MVSRFKKKLWLRRFPFNSKLHFKIFSFKNKKRLPCDANFDVPEPDAVYSVDVLETANCPHWGHHPEAHCLGSVTNTQIHTHKEHATRNDYLVIQASHEGKALVAS
jgi:hypothetical protein